MHWLKNLGTLLGGLYILSLSYQIGQFTSLAKYVDYNFIDLSIEAITLSAIEILYFKGYSFYLFLIASIFLLITRDSFFLKNSLLKKVVSSIHHKKYILIFTLFLALPFCFYSIGKHSYLKYENFVYYVDNSPYAFISSKENIFLLKNACEETYKYIHKTDIEKIILAEEKNDCSN